jgi:simple sugar transport system permease protein
VTAVASGVRKYSAIWISSWWTKIAIGILLFVFIALQRGLTVLWENRQSSPVTRVGTAITKQ